MVSKYKNQYTQDIDKNAKIKSVEFKQKIEILEDDNNLSEIINLDQAREKIYAKTKEAVFIEVKSGENLWTIGNNNNISVEELQNLNPQVDKEMRINPGDKLVISPEKPMLEVVIDFENTVVEDIPFETEYVKDSTMNESQRKTISEGVNGKQEVTYEIVLVNGNISEQKISNKKIIEPPVSSKVSVGTKKATVSRSGSSSGTNRVVSGGRITSPFGARVHPITGAEIFHKGIDIGASQGNSIYAYANGIVSFAGWKSGYGNFVEINHVNGLVTRYGHMSAIYVKKGQQVTAGQRIGAVGSTGASTGPHLHFEVLVNGVNKNPLNYL
ncbi:MAG: hypothetical protein CVU90_12585 [Firmicutes bacterium HGW-Firmicutes-15]|nr:MAG: hypothetical protein CVU90_12585 [Firmicutes bacterium HGW-Firmicutes-15]